MDEETEPIDTYIVKYNLTQANEGEPMNETFLNAVSLIFHMLEYQDFIVDFDQMTITTERAENDLILLIDLDVYSPHDDQGDE